MLIILDILWYWNYVSIVTSGRYCHFMHSICCWWFTWHPTLLLKTYLRVYIMSFSGLWWQYCFVLFLHLLCEGRSHCWLLQETSWAYGYQLQWLERCWLEDYWHAHWFSYINADSELRKYLPYLIKNNHFHETTKSK